MGDCFESLKEAFPEVAESILKKVLEDLKDVRDSSDTLGKFRDRVMARADEIRLAQAKFKMEKAQNLLKLKDRLDVLNQPAYEGNPLSGIQHEIVGSQNTKATKGNLGLAMPANAIKNKIMTPFLNALRTGGNIEAALSRTIDKQIMIEAFELDKEGGQPGKTGSPQALAIAKLGNAVNNSIRVEYDAAGYPIGKVEGYVMSQLGSHSMDKISPDESGWTKQALKNFDHDKTFGEGATSEEKLDWLKGMFKDVSEGRWASKSLPQGVSDDFNSGKVYGTGSKIMGARSVFFKDGENFYDYHSKYGEGGYLDTLARGVDRSSRNISQLRIFGTNPFDAMQGDVERMIEKYSGKDAIEKYGAEKANKIVESLQNNKENLKQSYQLTARMIEHPGVSTAAKVAQGTTDVVSAAVLGLSSLKKLTEWPMGAMLVSSLTGNNFFKAMGYMAHDFMTSGLPALPGMSTESKFGLKWMEGQREALLPHMINHIDDFTAALNADRYEQGLGNSQTPGMYSKIANFMYQLGINQHTNASRLSVIRTDQRFMGMVKDTSFNDLHPTLRANLGRWGIAAPQWDVIRQGFDPKLNSISTEAIQKLPTNAVQAVMDKYGIKGKPESFLANTVTNYLTRSLEISERTVLHTNAQAASFMYRRIPNPNNPAAAVARVLLQYKSIPLMFGNNYAMALGSGSENMASSFSGSMMNGIKDGSIKTVLAGAGAAAGLYYVRSVLYAEMHGKPIPDPTDPKVIEETLAGSGATTIVGDVLHSIHQGGVERGLKTLAGPAVSIGADTANSGLQMIYPTGHNTRTGEAQKLVTQAENITPFQSVPFVRPALDSLLFDNIHNAIDPQWLEKKQMREAKQKGAR